jgi:hypothetical protein
MKLALIRLLAIIDKHRDGIPTRRLLQQAGANEFHKLIMTAESEGYIRREQVKKPAGQKGNHMTANHLTPAGKKIVQAAGVLGL